MVYAILADGFEEIEALTVIDILRRAKIEVTVASAVESLQVMGAHGIRVTADCFVKDAKVSDLLFLPGGMPGVDNLEKSEETVALIRRQADKKAYIAAICAAPKILGGMGILEGRHAVCYPGFETELRGATVLDDAVVQDGNIITSRGAGTAADLAFHLVSLLKDDETAEALKQGMLYA